MTAESPPESEVEIGHVLFMDIVGFSKLLGDQQSECSNRLNQIVRNTTTFRAADASGRLIRLPTGDGMALVFFSGPEAPLQCASEVSRELKSSIPLRMGIHSGPVNKTIDVDGRTNVTGNGINMAQRLMDCGDAGHILLSKRIAEDLSQYGKWRPHLHDVGEAEVKHGTRIHVFNFYTHDVGNRGTPPRLKQRPSAPPARSTKLLVVAGLLGAIAAAAGVWFFASHSRQKPTPSISAPIIPEKSVAIFPFKPLSSQNRDEVLENGMADTLIAKLSTIREIIIPALTSARKYDEQEHDPLAAGRLLHVRSVLDGTLQKLGDRIRVTARLINVADGVSLWTQTFDEKFTDVFAVQDTIAQKVADALALQLSGDEQRRLTKRHTDNTEAYQLYLKGRFYWNKFTEEGFRKAIDHFREALDLDPNYPVAYAGLADSYSLLGELGFERPNDAFPKARGYAEKALALDDALSDAHLSLGIVELFYEMQLASAEKELRRAKELNPNNAQAYHFYGHYLQFSGRPQDAISEMQHAVQIDPTNVILNHELGGAYYFARQLDRAEAQLRKTLELEPNFPLGLSNLVVSLDVRGKFQEALVQLEKNQALTGETPDILVERARIYAQTGKRAEAEAIVKQLQNSDFPGSGQGVALACAALGDKDCAFDGLNKAFEARETLFWIKNDPIFDSLRPDPRFDALLKRLDDLQRR